MSKKDDKIILHPKLGLNPRRTVCNKCGNDGEAILLLGIGNYVATCSKCAMVTYGVTRNYRKKCLRCGNSKYNIRELKPSEKIPTICNKCSAEIEKFSKMLKEGGLPFRCAECGLSGIAPDSDYVRKYRKRALQEGLIKNINDSFGIEFSTCKEHSHIKNKGEI